MIKTTKKRKVEKMNIKLKKIFSLIFALIMAAQPMQTIRADELTDIAEIFEIEMQDEYDLSIPEIEMIEAIARNNDIMAAASAVPWDGTIATGYAGGTGTENDPYQIANGAQLAYLAQKVNSGTNYEGYCFVLTSNINLNMLKWTPIGSSSSRA